MIKLVLVAVSRNDKEILLRSKVFGVMYYEIEISPMVLSSIKFRPKSPVCLFL